MSNSGGRRLKEVEGGGRVACHKLGVLEVLAFIAILINENLIYITADTF